MTPPVMHDDAGALAHLLRRAGFGTRPTEWDAYTKLGYAATLDQLLHPETIPDHLDEILKDISGDFVDFDNLDSIKNWWIYRMVHTQRPLEEKMTLFWHNHFATANYKVDNPRLMWRQNDMFRHNALGNFRTMLGEVARDPAMLIWLDGMQNRKGKPNENFGRELLELFTMGFGSGYTETDVKEAARAFTGWRFSRDTGAFDFKPSQHDDDSKTFLGQSGNFNGDDILDIVVRHPATANFVCTKLFKFFVHDHPTPNDIAPITTAYFKSGYDVRSVMSAILKSPSFQSADARYAKIKSPAEFIVSSIRTLDVPMAVFQGIPGAMRNMGQDLFNPPNVKGWPEGRSWLNTTTLLGRMNFSAKLTTELDRRGLLTDRVRAAFIQESPLLGTPDQAVDAVWAAFLPGHTPSAATRSALTAFVQDDAHPDKFHFDTRASGLVSLTLSAPEYQLA